MLMIKSLTLFLVAFIFFAASANAENENNQPVQPWIRVSLSTGKNSISVISSGPCRVNFLNSRTGVNHYPAGRTFTFDLSGDRVKFGSNSGDGFTIIPDNETDFLSVDGKKYRGIIRIAIFEKKLVCINVLPIEQYLWGVVPSEMPFGWHIEALKAQAVAARTYSLRAIDAYPERPFDVYNTVIDQVYNGVNGEKDSSTRACRDTEGVTLTINDLPIIAYFHACAGGMTETGAEGLGKDFGYLQSVESPDGKVFPWTYKVSVTAIKNALSSNGYPTGTIKRIWISRLTSSGRAGEITVEHSSGVLYISGREFRRILGYSNLKSTMFTINGQILPSLDIMPEARHPIFDQSTNSTDLNPGLPVPQLSEITGPKIWAISSNGIFESSAEMIQIVKAAGATRVSIVGLTVASAGMLVSGNSDEYSFFLTEGREEKQLPIPTGIRIEKPQDSEGYPSGGFYIFSGQGFGHGAGMSQHGARIYAEQGWKYTDILMHYYPGTELKRFW